MTLKQIEAYKKSPAGRATHARQVADQAIESGQYGRCAKARALITEAWDEYRLHGEKTPDRTKDLMDKVFLVRRLCPRPEKKPSKKRR